MFHTPLDLPVAFPWLCREVEGKDSTYTSLGDQPRCRSFSGAGAVGGWVFCISPKVDVDSGDTNQLPVVVRRAGTNTAWPGDISAGADGWIGLPALWAGWVKPRACRGC